MVVGAALISQAPEKSQHDQLRAMDRQYAAKKELHNKATSHYAG